MILVPDLEQENVATESQGCHARNTLAFKLLCHHKQLTHGFVLGEDRVRPYKNKQELLEMRAALAAMRAVCEQAKVSMSQYEGSMHKLQVRI